MVFGDTLSQRDMFPIWEARRLLPSADWKYDMRRSMQEVAPGLFLGPYSSAQKSNLDSLKHHKITHIVCVRQDIEAKFIKPNFPEEFQYLVINIADSPEENIKQYFEPVGKFLDDAFARGGKALIHGNIGQSRSAALAVAYVMKKYRMGLNQALCMVNAKRCCAFPNPGFQQQLEQWGEHLSLPSGVYGACPCKRARLDVV